MRHDKSKKSKARLWLLCLVVVIVYGFAVCAQPFASLQPVSRYRAVDAASRKVDLPWPAYGQAAIGAIGNGVLATHGVQTPIATASVAKVLTTLAVLRLRPLTVGQEGPTITINQADVDSYHKYIAQGGSVVSVNFGEQLSEYQALQALLLPSANNMAETLARWSAGSMEAFNTYANAYAQELGLKSFKMTDPSGLLPSTVASARDLTVLGEQAILHPVVAQIVALPSATLPVAGTVYNYNVLLGDERNIGIKTGNNDQNTGAFLFAFRQPAANSSVIIVGAVLGAPNLLAAQQDAKRLADAAAPHFRQVDFVKAGQVVGTYTAPDGQQVRATAAQSLSLTVWDGYTFTNTASLQTLRAPVKAGSKVGTITVRNTRTNVANVIPVTLQKALKPPTLTERLRHPF